MSIYTKDGLQKLGEIVREARLRHSMSFDRFGKLCGLHSMTIYRIETAQFGEPTNDALSKIAPHVGLSLLELIAIASEQEYPDHRLASDITPLIGNLPVSELRKLEEIIQERLEIAESLQRNSDTNH